MTSKTDPAGPHKAPSPAGEAESAQTIMNNALNNSERQGAGSGGLGGLVPGA